jgi:hypothetical protein
MMGELHPGDGARLSPVFTYSIRKHDIQTYASGSSACFRSAFPDNSLYSKNNPMKDRAGR